MNIKNTFRILILLSFILPLVGVSYSIFSIDSQSPQIQEIVSWHGYGGFFDTEYEEPSNTELLLFSALIIFVAVILAGCIGLFFFKKWGRTVVVISGALSLILLPFNGVIVELAYESALNEISSILFGAILAMSYLPPLSQEFENT
ncbi:hypothetical protein [Thiohalophilus thiocyanatoxydans]|uniref:hypothetical protein n=1 Tax=Thiohalophilus thiocyanatoxydans TaxID=381308 RepID=UPI001066FDFC|nr:hypothetical protein [Thiohalophilus thiocyanatoxydans]